MSAAARPVTVGLVGCGAVGREVLKRLIVRADVHAARVGVRFNVTALADRSGLLWDPAGLDGAELASAVEAKTGGRCLADLASGAFLSADWPAAAVSREHAGTAADALVDANASVVIDTTASDTTGLLIQVRRRGVRLVLANKIPLSGPLADWDALTEPGRPAAQWGTTVASSLPIAAVVRALRDAGDPPTHMIGCLSGTIGVLLSGIAAGTPAGTVLAAAVASGVAEPDPRRDLSGRDLTAKTLILARTAGLRLEPAEVDCTPIVPGLDDIPPSLTLISEHLDQVAGELRTMIADSGGRLRYLTEITGGRAQVALGVAPDDVAAVAPTNSAIRIETAGFTAHPLFLSGRGGGAAATAEGVISDLVSVSRCL